MGSLRPKLVAKNGILNLLYQAFPAVAALVMIPLTISELGKDFFAIHSLTITAIILFNYFSFGLGTSVSREIAKLFATEDRNKERVSRIFNSAVFTTFGLSCIVIILGLIGVDTIMANFGLEEANQLYENLARHNFLCIFVSSPIFLLLLVFRGCLEGYQLFRVTSLNRAILSTSLFLCPLFSIVNWINIFQIVYVLIIINAVSAIALLLVIIKKLDVSINIGHWEREASLSLLRAGGWMSASTLSAVVFYYSDRFLVSGVLGLIPLSYYVASYDLISKLNIISGSVTASVYPAIASWRKVKDYASIRNTFFNYQIFLGFTVFLTALFFALFSEQVLTIWIDEEFSKNSSQILSILSVSVFLNCMSAMPMRSLHGLGEEKKVAFVHIFMIIPYLLFLFRLIDNYGIVGAAIADLSRTFVECILLHIAFLRNNYVNLPFKRKILLFVSMILAVIFLLISTKFYTLNLFMKSATYILVSIAAFLIILFPQRGELMEYIK